jgi:predicted phage gp36 major capsid-like protein
MKCKKPGNGLPNLSKMQKQLNDKISQMAEMKKQEGELKSGGKSPTRESKKELSGLFPLITETLRA